METKLKKFLGSGGLGDFLICYSKCFNYIEKDEKFHFTYIDDIDNRRTKIDYSKYAQEFLDVQEIEYNIIKAKQFEYYAQHGKEYDYCFSPQVYGEVNSFLLRPNSIRSDSHPYIDFKTPFVQHEEQHSIAINYFAGNGDDSRRVWSSDKFLQDLIKYLSVKLGYIVYLIGIDDGKEFEMCIDARKTSFMNELGIIKHCSKVICFSGFIHLFSCFSNKQVIVKWENEAARDWYFHPKWQKNNVRFWKNETFSEIAGLL